MLAKQSSPRDEKDEIAIIQQTDVDAKSAKRSATALGYLNDPFIAEFVKIPDRKSPIINRGIPSQHAVTRCAVALIDK
jgi:hypothetical protein